LPGVDGLAPLLLVFERSAGDLESMRAFRTEEVGVMTVPFAPAPELDHRQVPTEGYGHHALFMRGQGEAHRKSASQRVAAGGYGLGHVGQAAIFREGIPNIRPIAIGEVSAQVGDLCAVAGLGGDGELSVPLFGDRAGAHAVEDDAADGATGRVAVWRFRDEAVGVLLVQRAIEGVRGIAEPAHHVSP